MLFNSYVFIFVFLPLTVAVYHLLRGNGCMRMAIFSLVVASLVFYGWWSLQYLGLLLGLVAIDLVIAKQIAKWRDINRPLAKLFLVIGLAVNLSALGYYKYANFFVDNVNALFGADLVLATIVLPIGISFFTFQKIAFLFDLYAGKVDRVDALDYFLFVTFFPQLIAGPIVHHNAVPEERLARSVTANASANALARCARCRAAGWRELADAVGEYAWSVYLTAAVFVTGSLPLETDSGIYAAGASRIGLSHSP